MYRPALSAPRAKPRADAGRDPVAAPLPQGAEGLWRAVMARGIASQGASGYGLGWLKLT